VHFQDRSAWYDDLRNIEEGIIQRDYPGSLL
jgi:hypothetical protein